MIGKSLQHAMWLATNGAYGEAVETLDQTLRNLKKPFHQDIRTSQPENDTNSFQIVVGPKCWEYEMKGEAYDNHNTREIHFVGRAFLLDGEVGSTYEHIAIATAVILYNKGMMFHIVGCGCANSLPIWDYAQKAKRLYEKAYCLLEACSSSALLQDFDIPALNAALVNNLAHICSQLCDWQGEQLYLYTLLLLLNSESDRFNLPNSIDLSLNVILYYGSHRPAAAA